MSRTRLLCVFCIVLAPAFLCCTEPGCAAPLSPEETLAQDKRIAEERTHLESADPEVRLQAFREITAPIRTHNGFGPIDPEKAAHSTRLAITDLLRRHIAPENRNLSNTNFPPADAEDDGLPDLIQTVLELHDPSSIQLLWNPDVLTSGAMATDALAYFGHGEARRVVRAFTSRPYSSTDLIRASLGRVILSMLRQGTIDDPALLREVNGLLIEQSYSRVVSCRGWAAEGLSYFRDDQSQGRLRQLAATDPWYFSTGLSGKPEYLVREIAQSALNGPLRQAQRN